MATKGCKPKFEELTAYFKAYDSRDETIGRGMNMLRKDSCCWESTMTCTATTHPWSMDAGATLKLERVSVAQWGSRRRERRHTSSSPTSSPSSPHAPYPNKSTSTMTSVPPLLRSRRTRTVQLIHPYADTSPIRGREGGITREGVMYVRGLR